MRGVACVRATTCVEWCRCPVRPADRGRASGLPQYATLFALDTGSRASLKRRLDDRGEANRLGLYTPFLAEGTALATLPPEADPRRRQWLATARWYAESAHRMSAIPQLTVGIDGYPLPYAVSQLTGAYVEVPDLLASQHTIVTAADCDAYLARLDAFGRAIEQDTATSQAQPAAGVIPPDFICDRTISQLDTLAAGRGADAGLVTALTSRARTAGIGNHWDGRAARLVDGPIAAALGRKKAHVAQLRRHASAAAGLHGRPRGDEFYATALRFHTTLDAGPAEVHRIGLDGVASIRSEIDALLVRLGHTGGTVGERLTALTRDPAQLFGNDEAGRTALLTYVRARTDDVIRRLPAAFSTMARQPMQIRRVPIEQQLGAPTAYSLPGTIYFNLASTADWPRWTLPTVIYHEGYPGHHFQNALVTETGGTPLLFKLLTPNAYNEGWALYAELVADELGVYEDDPVGRLGRLRDDLFRSCRLVVDTGLQASGG